MTRALALIAVAALAPAGAAADSRFDLPRVTAVSAASDSASVVLVDEASGRRTRLAVGDRYAGTYRLVDVDPDRAVLRRIGGEPIYYVLPVEAAGGADASPSEDAPGLALMNPYAQTEVRRVLAPERARAGREVVDPYAEREQDASPSRPALKDPYAERESDSSRPEPRREVVDPYAERPTPRARSAPAPREISRSQLDGELADFQALERQVSVRPEGDGVRITSLEAGSLLYELGLRRGDLVRAVAGRRIDSAAAAAALYAHLARADEIAVKIERGGRELVLRYELVP